jgi:hypothetical protein
MVGSCSKLSDSGAALFLSCKEDAMLVRRDPLAQSLPETGKGSPVAPQCGPRIELRRPVSFRATPFETGRAEQAASRASAGESVAYLLHTGSSSKIGKASYA